MSHFLDAGKQSIGYFAPNRISRKSHERFISKRKAYSVNNVIVRHCLVLLILHVIPVKIDEETRKSG